MIQFKMLKIVFRQKAPLWDGGFSGSKKTEAVFKHKTTGVGPTPENHLTLTSHWSREHFQIVNTEEQNTFIQFGAK